MRERRQIVLFGPPLCGKRTLLEVFSRAAGVEMQRTTRPAGTAGFPCAFLTATLDTPAIELVTLPGSPWDMEAWWPSVADAAALVLMLDSQL